MSKNNEHLKFLPLQPNQFGIGTSSFYHFDPLGSYTGLPLMDDEPEQDADDL